MIFELLIKIDLGMGFFRDTLSRIPISGIRDPDFLFWARSKKFRVFTVFWRVFGLGIFTPEIRDFSKFWDLYARDFRKISEIRDFSGFFTFGISRVFFRWMGYPDKKPTLLILTFQKKWRSKPNSLQEEILRIKFSSPFNHQDTSWHSSPFLDFYL